MEITPRACGTEQAPTKLLIARPTRLPASIPSRRSHSPDEVIPAPAAASEAAVDRELINRFNGGDGGAFDEIVARHRHRLLSIALRFLRNHADAEEVVQDTLIRAHRGLARFRNESSLATWLHRIAVNLARNRYWYFFRRRRHLTRSLDCPLSADSTGTLSDLVAAPDGDPARQVAVEEFATIVAGSMEKLEPGQREILNMRNQLHHSYEEIARSLGISEGTVKSRIARARGRLRVVIAEDYPEFSAPATKPEGFETQRDCGQRTAAA
jgi:RNA polymerase sigma-70 factor (ECF subfamily)